MKGWSSGGQISRALGLDPATVSRVLRGHVAPGGKFIATTLAAFPELEFDDVFEVVAEPPDPPAAPARDRGRPRAAGRGG